MSITFYIFEHYQLWMMDSKAQRVFFSFDSPQKAEDFISSLSQQKTYATALREGNGKTAATISPARREGLDGRDGGGPSCPGRDDGRMDMDAC